MLISQFIDPEDLVKLTPRQQELLNTIIAAEILSSPNIRAELSKKVEGGIKAFQAANLKKRTRVKKGPAE